MHEQARPPDRASAPTRSQSTSPAPRGLQNEEPLMFEIGDAEHRRRPARRPAATPTASAALTRKSAARPARPHRARGAAPLRAPVARRTTPSTCGIYPLGSCTMKHNPRLNEKMARLPGFADIHPLQPVSTVQGALELMDELAHWLKTLTGMPAVALSPKAGAHGELCGMMAIRAAQEARGRRAQARPGARIRPRHQPGDRGLPRLHGRCRSRPTIDGRVDLAAVKAELGPDVAAIMLTNPNTCGLFERDIIEIADAVHEAGALLLLRRRQLQRHRRAWCGRAISASTPCTSTCTRPSPPRTAAAVRAPGRWCCREALAPFAPVPFVVHGASGFDAGRAGRRQGLRPHRCASTARWACSCARSPTC